MNGNHIVHSHVHRLVLFALIGVLITTPAITQSFADTAKTLTEKQDEKLKKNCVAIQKIQPSNIPKYCAKYGIESQVQLPTDPIEYQKMTYNQKINDIVKQEQDLTAKREQLGEDEFKKQFDVLEKQIESYELKLQSLDSGRIQKAEEVQNTCDSGTVPDAFGNCVTVQQKKIQQMKATKGVSADLIDDNENLKSENAQLKSRVDALEKKVSSLENIIKQLQIAIAKITG